MLLKQQAETVNSLKKQKEKTKEKTSRKSLRESIFPIACLTPSFIGVMIFFRAAFSFSKSARL